MALQVHGAKRMRDMITCFSNFSQYYCVEKSLAPACLKAVYYRGHAHSAYAERGRGGVLPLRTALHKCDVTYVVSLAYKGGGGVKKS